MNDDNSRLIADRFRNDPRVAKAKALLAETLREYSGSMTDVRPADPQLAESYADQLARLTEARGAAPYFPYIASGIGNGPWVELADGSVKLDFIGGIGVHGMGHSHEQMLDAAIDGALEDTVMQGNLQQNRPSIALCERLISIANSNGSELAHCLLSTSGAMANENALKIAFHARRPADRIIAFTNCFAGRSLALAALTDRPSYRSGLPETLLVDYLPFFDPAKPDASTQAAVDRLQELLTRYPGRHAAFWAEPIAGEGGYVAGSPEFFKTLLKPIREAGILTVFDEVQSFGRTTAPLAYQSFDLDRYVDIVTIGKITQVCATLYRNQLQPTAPILSQTFTGASASIATGQRMLDQLASSGCFGVDGRNQRNHDHFVNGLRSLAQRYPGQVEGPYGEGMMVAVTPGDGSYETANRWVRDLYDAGLICFLCGGNPHRVRFLPPPTITTPEHIDHAIALIDRMLQTTQPKAAH
ncbi:Acetylornithine aminotransferase [Rosistilla carotiformis]|uniref:Acetylornithine aminotransferase n=1 Tax=Rosistilla carotiformis TaxID=2528017 RepID=A0A518JW23_9BACT|nr:aminotransferase class III-fold pyridoxal phosphate-dependent enzyme [Rosistilla carotiformis]QDV69741.1 Acetylornithine aminotransferase [Rosistilla carotiformis]